MQKLFLLYTFSRERKDYDEASKGSAGEDKDVLQSCVDLDLCFDYKLKVSWLSEELTPRVSTSSPILKL